MQVFSTLLLAGGDVLILGGGVVDEGTLFWETGVDSFLKYPGTYVNRLPRLYSFARNVSVFLYAVVSRDSLSWTNSGFLSVASFSLSKLTALSPFQCMRGVCLLITLMGD